MSTQLRLLDWTGLYVRITWFTTQFPSCFRHHSFSSWSGGVQTYSLWKQALIMCNSCLCSTPETKTGAHFLTISAKTMTWLIFHSNEITHFSQPLNFILSLLFQPISLFLSDSLSTFQFYFPPSPHTKLVVDLTSLFFWKEFPPQSCSWLAKILVCLFVAVLCVSHWMPVVLSRSMNRKRVSAAE